MCSKGGKQVACKSTRQEALEAVAWHLHSSTCHQMEFDAAMEMADDDEYILVADEESRHTEAPAAEDPKHKKRKTNPSSLRGTSSSGSGGQLAIRDNVVPSQTPYRIRKGELEAIVDSLKRATKASVRAAQISRATATAFDDQSETFRQATDLLQGMLEKKRR